MKTLIIYDSVFGNTAQIAQAMCSALGAPENARVYHASEVKPEQLTGIDLLIVGSPTRGFRPTQAITTFLRSLAAHSIDGVKVAAFDTRISLDQVHSVLLSVLVRLFGYAARPIADRLKAKGGSLVAPPEGFFVKGSQGPLKEGELQRAIDWVKALN
jgi:flavodoxin